MYLWIYWFDDLESHMDIHKRFDCIRIIIHWNPFLLNDVVYGISNHFINYFQSWIHIQNIFFIFIVQTEHNNMKSPRLVVLCIKHLVCVDISVVNCHYLVMRVECSWEQQPEKWERMTTALKMEGYNRTSMLIMFILMIILELKHVSKS